MNRPITRRAFLRGGALLAASLCVPAGARARTIAPGTSMKTGVARALVLWYSQTGHTRRIGRVVAADVRKADRQALAGYGLIAVGSPVQYMDVPSNLRDWLGHIPALEGVPVASFCTFGGTGNNQHNTAFSVLEALAAKGGVPAGMAAFGNMSTFAPTWSLGNEKQILAFRHLPNRETYARARAFAAEVLGRVRAGTAAAAETELSFSELTRSLNTRWWTKRLIGAHEIDEAACTGCGTCAATCPAGAIGPDRPKADRSRCLACMGCVNNCPAQAVVMEFLGKRVYGFIEFKRRNAIATEEPPELA